MQSEEKEPKVNVKKKQDPRFTREQILKSKRYSLRPDLVLTVLEKDKTYTLEEAEGRIEKFRKGVL